MVYSVTKYRCSRCHSEWREHAEAQRCEELPVPARSHKVGDVLHYGTEESLGTRWMYTGAHGTVKGYRLVVGRGEEGPIHCWLYAVEEENGFGVAGVFQYPDGRLQSPAEFRRIKMGPEFVAADPASEPSGVS